MTTLKGTYNLNLLFKPTKEIKLTKSKKILTESTEPEYQKPMLRNMSTFLTN